MNLIQILMTPSEVVIKLTSYILSYIEALFYLKFFKNVLNIKTNTKTDIIYILITATFANIINIFAPQFYVLNLLLFAVLLIYLFKQDAKKTFIGLLSIYIAFFISSYILEIFIRLTLKSSINSINQIPLYFFLTSLLIYFIGYSFSYIDKIIRKLMNMFDLPIKYTVLINLFFRNNYTYNSIIYIFNVP